VLATALATVLGAALLACTNGSADPGERHRGDARAGAHQGCGPLRYDEVRGRAPSYLDRRVLGRFRNDHAVCAGLWLPAGRGFIPQAVSVRGRTAWVSGFDGSGLPRDRFCMIERVDLRTGKRLGSLEAIDGQIGTRDPVTCRHGGGLVRDEHGLWLVETRRVWLIDPATLEVDRLWALTEPLRGSFALLDGDGRLGLGRWHPRRAAQVDWFDTGELVASSALDITPEMAEGATPAPRRSQGGVWAALDGHRAAAWFTQSVTRCGVLVGPEGTRRRAMVPGAEGMDLVGDDALWVVSESGTKHYQELGGRPVVPMLVRLDLADFTSWRRPDCSV
jgi:hypothetical protein